MKQGNTPSSSPEKPNMEDVIRLFRDHGRDEEFLTGLRSEYEKMIQVSPQLAAELLLEMTSLSRELWDISRSKEVLVGIHMRMKRIQLEGNTEVAKLLRQKVEAIGKMNQDDYDIFCDEIRGKIDVANRRRDDLIKLEMGLLNSLKIQ